MGGRCGSGAWKATRSFGGAYQGIRRYAPSGAASTSNQARYETAPCTFFTKGAKFPLNFGRPASFTLITSRCKMRRECLGSARTPMPFCPKFIMMTMHRATTRSAETSQTHYRSIELLRMHFQHGISCRIPIQSLSLGIAGHLEKQKLSG